MMKSFTLTRSICLTCCLMELGRYGNRPWVRIRDCTLACFGFTIWFKGSRCLGVKIVVSVRFFSTPVSTFVGFDPSLL